MFGWFKYPKYQIKFSQSEEIYFVWHKDSFFSDWNKIRDWSKMSSGFDSLEEAQKVCDDHFQLLEKQKKKLNL
jgi:hypothetical protein